MTPLAEIIQSREPTNLYDLREAIDFRVARTKDELEKACSLVYAEYLKKGYIKENPSKLRLSLYNALPQTTSLIAITDEQQVISTATVIPDSSLGLPMDEIYSEELAQFRQEKKRICEVSMLASDIDFFENYTSRANRSKVFYRFMLSFFKILLDCVKDNLKLELICIAINPKHKTIFDHLLFQDLGDLKIYPYVNNAPAIGKYINVYSIKEGFSMPGKEGLYKAFVLNNTDPARFAQKITFGPEDLRYFFIEKTDIFKTAPTSQMDYIKSCYPAYRPFC